MEEGGVEERLSFRIVNVHLSDQGSDLLSKHTILRVQENNGEKRAAAAGGEEDESLLQMSKLGLPTSFSTAPRRPFSQKSKRHRKSRCRDQRTTSLLCDVASKSVERPPFRRASAQVSIEVSVEDDAMRVSSDQANHCADANILAYSPLPTDEGANDGEVSASSCGMVVALALAKMWNCISGLEALLLKREPTGCGRAKMSDRVIVESVETMVASDNNAVEDWVERIGKGGSTTSKGGASFVDEGSLHINGGNLHVVDADSVGLDTRVNIILVEVPEQENHVEDTHIPDARGSNWSSCWDAHYGRYYFYNAETQESTWEPPKGFETFTSISFVQDSKETNGIAVAENKEASLEDNFKTIDLLHGASCAEVVSSDDWLAGMVAKGGDVLTDSNNVALLVKDASSSRTVAEHEEIVQSNGTCLEVGAIASYLPASSEDLKWSACWDDYNGRYYFYNAETLESTWEPPKGFEDHNENNILADGISINEVSCPKESKAESFLEDSSKMGSSVQVVEVVSSPRDPNHQESSIRREEQIVFDVERSVCQEISNGATECGVVHVEVANHKVAALKKQVKKAANYYVRLANQHVDAAAISPTISKYWFQRFHLFSKYESGIKLDEEGWFSVTPEAIAKHQAARCKRGVIVDAFTGVGGNAIQFALAGHHVVAIDNDSKRLEYAQHNAKVYGVADCIDFVLGDFFSVSSSMHADVVFLSPPWGGPNYLNAPVYDILTMLQPKDGATLLNVARSVAVNIILFLPRNVDMNQLAELSKTLPFPCSCEVERNFLNGKLKAVTAYYGQFASTVEVSTF